MAEWHSEARTLQLPAPIDGLKPTALAADPNQQQQPPVALETPPGELHAGSSMPTARDGGSAPSDSSGDDVGGERQHSPSA